MSSSEQAPRLLSMTLNGRVRHDAVGDNILLLDYLRETCNLTGTKQGCDGGECGACTVLVDGQTRLSCITLTAECEGKSVETIESLATNGKMSAIQRGFHEKLGSQCGYCTPGMITTAHALLSEEPDAGADRVREVLSGNICRCTGYIPIVEAVLEARADYPHSVFFDFDDARLSPAGQSRIATLAAKARRLDVPRITVLGHADSSGEAAHNLSLSLRRADAVKRALIRRGVPRGQVAVAASGETRLRIDTGDNAREARNRRVEILFQSPTSW